ncbi:uncharacterized protein CDAR_460801 [Caerostris darwini]|uniref:Uncharacterized protein n=1 Tax=Caerostris darwini TaxID=1538125 RepID=A0AAV4PS46_9ARAC|nr:uncharacterized protein CDAR_460801 [Caerostris darwini]
MKLVILHLSLLVACAFGEYTKGLSGKFPKLEDIKPAATKKAEARSLDGIPEPKSEEVLGYGLGDVKTSYGSDGSIEKTLPLPGGHEISVGVGKDGGFGYGYTTDEHGNIGGLSHEHASIGGLSHMAGLHLAEGLGVSEKSHEHGSIGGLSHEHGSIGGLSHMAGLHLPAALDISEKSHGHGYSHHGHGHGHGHAHGHGHGHGNNTLL